MAKPPSFYPPTFWAVQLSSTHASSPPSCRFHPMSVSLSIPQSSVTFDALACASCGDPYTAQNDDGIPATFCCGHSVCNACAKAVSVVSVVKCLICQSVQHGDMVLNAALGAYCDSVRAGEQSSPARAVAGGSSGDSGDALRISDGGNGDAVTQRVPDEPAVKKAKVARENSESNSPQPPFPSPKCLQHQLPITHYNVFLGALWCSRCVANVLPAAASDAASSAEQDPDNKSTGVSAEAGDAALPIVGERALTDLRSIAVRKQYAFQDYAGGLAVLAGRIVEEKDCIVAECSSTANAVAEHIDGIVKGLLAYKDAVKAALDDHCDFVTKQFTARHDEVLVSQSQMEGCSSMLAGALVGSPSVVQFVGALLCVQPCEQLLATMPLIPALSSGHSDKHLKLLLPKQSSSVFAFSEQEEALRFLKVCSVAVLHCLDDG